MSLPKITKNPGPLLKSETKGSIDVIPQEFRASIGILTETQENPVDIGPDDPKDPLMGGLQESRVVQTRTDERKKTNLSFLGSFTTSLVSYVKLASGLIGIRTRSLVPEGTPLTADALTEEASQKNLGIGLAEQDVLEAPSLFTGAEYSEEIPDVVPQEFRVAVPTDTTTLTQTGTAAAVTLGTGELHHTESQIDVFKKRVRSVFRSVISYPVVLIDNIRGAFSGEGSEYTGPATRTRTLNTGLQPIDSGFTVLDSKVKNLGDGTSLKETDSQASFPILTDNVMDRRTGIITNRVKQVVATGTANPAGSSTLTRDADRAIRVTETVDPTSLAAVKWAFPGDTNIEVPTELTSITVYQEGNASAGNYSESGSYALTAHGSGGIALRGHASGSATALYEVGYTVKEAWGSNVPCTHVMFFANATDTRATLLSRVNTIMGITVNDWPKFVPQGIVVVVSGGKSNVSLELSAVAHDVAIADFNGVVTLSASARTNGGGSLIDLGSTTKAVRIPPTIHAAIAVSGGNTFTESFSSSSSISTGVNSSSSLLSGSASAIVNTPSFLATPGQSTIPTTGSFLHRLSTEPYVPGTIMVHAEVIDFANVG